MSFSKRGRKEGRGTLFLTGVENTATELLRLCSLLIGIIFPTIKRKSPYQENFRYYPF
jgi:hypothetical protein